MVDYENVIKIAKGNLDARRKALREHLAQSPRPPGLVKVDDATFMAAVDAMIQQYPAIPLRTPGGAEVVESPWILMLAYVDGGKDVLARIESIQQKMVTP